MTARGLAARLALSCASLLAAALLVEAALSVAAWRAQKRWDGLAAEGKAPTTILCLGESTTGPPLFGVDRSWPQQLQEILDERPGAPRAIVVNRGRSGTNSAAILARLPADLERFRPTVVVAMIGVNDDRWFGVASLAPRPGLAGILSRTRLWRLIRFSLNAYEARREFVDPPPKPRGAETAACIAARAYPDARLKEAVELCRTAERAAPGDAEPAMELAALLNRSKDYPGAAAAAERALRLDPKFTRAWAQLGAARRMMGRDDEAEAAFRAAAKIRFDDESSAILLVRMQMEKGRWADAARTILATRGASPGWSLALAPVAAPAEPGPPVIPGPVTRENYRTLAAILRARGVPLVAMQYPTLDPAPLAALFPPGSGVTVVGNRDAFLAELARAPYDALFEDRYGGTWGHTTPRGSRLIAEAAAKALAAANRVAK